MNTKEKREKRENLKGEGASSKECVFQTNKQKGAGLNFKNRRAALERDSETALFRVAAAALSAALQPYCSHTSVRGRVLLEQLCAVLCLGTARRRRELCSALRVAFLTFVSTVRFKKESCSGIRSIVPTHFRAHVSCGVSRTRSRKSPQSQRETSLFDPLSKNTQRNIANRYVR